MSDNVNIQLKYYNKLEFSSMNGCKFIKVIFFGFVTILFAGIVLEILNFVDVNSDSALVHTKTETTPSYLKNNRIRRSKKATFKIKRDLTYYSQGRNITLKKRSSIASALGALVSSKHSTSKRKQFKDIIDSLVPNHADYAKYTRDVAKIEFNNITDIDFAISTFEDPTTTFTTEYFDTTDYTSKSGVLTTMTSTPSELPSISTSSNRTSTFLPTTKYTLIPLDLGTTLRSANTTTEFSPIFEELTNVTNSTSPTETTTVSETTSTLSTSTLSTSTLSTSTNVPPNTSTVSTTKSLTTLSTTMSPINCLCPEEKEYIKGIGNITWPTSFIGEVAIPANCSATAYIRRCLDADNGAYWGKPNGTFSKCGDFESDLFELVSSEDNAEAVQHLLNMSYYFHNKVSPMETKYSALILKSFSQNYSAINLPFSRDNFLNVINNILNSSESVLVESQKTLNSTDVILESIDLFLNNFEKDLSINQHFYFIRKGKLNSSCVGWMMCTNNTIVPLSSDISLEDIIKEQPIVATYFSDFTEFDDNVEASFTFFNDVKLFNDDTVSELNPWIVSIDVSTSYKILTNPIHIIFGQSNTSTYNKTCAHWLYGQKDNVNIFGSWYGENSTVIGGQRYFICNYTHMTHFGMLISESDSKNFILAIITYIGTVLSCLGVITVLGSTFINKNVRSKKNICLLLNYLLSIILLPIALYISNYVTGNVPCKLSGMFLHYTIICQSVWSLVLATFQYRRYITVYQNYRRYILNKSIIIGWLTGIIPVVIVALISIDNYHKNEGNLCYLPQILIDYAVILPILLITMTNFSIFILIVYNLTRSKKPLRNKELLWNILKLTHFLFYLFGLSWVTGIMLLITKKIFVNYLFTCLTSLQGFSICIHYVITTKHKMLNVKKSMQTSRMSFKSYSAEYQTSSIIE